RPCRLSVHSVRVLPPVSRLRSASHAPAPADPYPLSLHDALPISRRPGGRRGAAIPPGLRRGLQHRDFSLDPRSLRSLPLEGPARSEEHTSELQSPDHLVCRLLLEKKNQWITPRDTFY